MVIVKIIGGLGNQMFQYAVGKSLAIQNKTSLKLDIGAFKRYKLHDYMLDKLNIKAEIATDKDLKKIFGLSIIRFFYRVPKLGLLIKRKSIHKEKGFNFDKKLLNLKGENIYLNGYYQSEKYFSDIESIIRQDFVPIKELSGKNATMADLITKTNSVSIHVRRGDYVSNPTTNSIHGTCSIDYYKKAIEIIAEKNNDLVFFIFSDDCDWARNNIEINYKKYFIDFNGREKCYEDIRLMSLCKHNIIANSSFSWWGAWLNSNLNKIVVAPSRWFNVDRNSVDIIPESWVKI